jgi:hypothetical protein
MGPLTGLILSRKKKVVSGKSGITPFNRDATTPEITAPSTFSDRNQSEIINKMKRAYVNVARMETFATFSKQGCNYGWHRSSSYQITASLNLKKAYSNLFIYLAIEKLRSAEINVKLCRYCLLE